MCMDGTMLTTLAKLETDLTRIVWLSSLREDIEDRVSVVGGRREETERERKK